MEKNKIACDQAAFTIAQENKKEQTPQPVVPVVDSYPGPPLRIAKNSMLSLILDGAAVHRCNDRLVFSAGFSR